MNHSVQPSRIEDTGRWVFDLKLKHAREEACYETEMELVINRGICDIREGELTTNVDAFAERVLKRRDLWRA